jgi:hypothetical protein
MDFQKLDSILYEDPLMRLELPEEIFTVFESDDPPDNCRKFLEDFQTRSNKSGASSMTSSSIPSLVSSRCPSRLGSFSLTDDENFEQENVLKDIEEMMLNDPEMFDFEQEPDEIEPEITNFDDEHMLTVVQPSTSSRPSLFGIRYNTENDVTNTRNQSAPTLDSKKTNYLLHGKSLMKSLATIFDRNCLT